MPLDKDIKKEVIDEFKKSDNDVGSPRVQIGMLSKRIDQLSVHLEKAPRDFHSRKGLVSMVARRRKLLNYIKKNNPEEYLSLTEKLGLRK